MYGLGLKDPLRCPKGNLICIINLYKNFQFLDFNSLHSFQTPSQPETFYPFKLSGASWNKNLYEINRQSLKNLIFLLFGPKEIKPL